MHLPHARRHSGTHGGRTGGHNHNLVVSSAFDRQWWIICSTGDAGGSCRSNSTWRPPTNLNASSSCSRRSASVPAGSVRTGAGGAHLFAHTRRDGPVEHTHDPARATCCQMKATSARRKQQDQQSHVKGAPSLHSSCGHKLQIFTTRRSKLLLLLNLLAF